MKLEELKEIPIYQTRAIAESTRDSEETILYLSKCVNRLYSGDFGKMSQEDSEANMEELERGEGRIVARYEKTGALENDVYIIVYFSEAMRGNLDFNNGTILYVNEY